MHNYTNLAMEKTRTKPAKSELKKPSRFQVLLLNDDYTTMEFVIQVLQQFFDKTEESAYAIMLKVHIDGEGVCGIYSFDVAQTKISQVINFSRQNEQPLMCVIRELDLT
ncbi:ATP-dependent Clp protease adaptor protein ClpS [uncultured Gammaproteobacteria bacterium]|jgi:ATP-dependent Clp protease adaptor protein ClpS|uniref:ATP-dependent Clp protease adapter ClpS n=1 Tax=thiotrophic endosymbiont of Bathymodiolus puteoserpentis (Logatchev) TaxID=343240 RepID=UPI0010B04625|nr:ATP-dependent Clp protease adapter ClpS [thiotrophic endosymbiont of Bathymodiolus puteoserpentis (Logatchev)]CAC9490635.1 ATP-dependent Clp protease adaptor protein ClpS [uncultured Gammaproteobacteria bacterium]CAC9495447.1 ATP-dependent Clp protease adaptor protein ClpS [uncultured Gammaproteobacteria bacterium]CAC9592182.1 ATP-dependent Clp protease adaptor protein ClpS [uncultured Gammaproteobacteria bacterium]CAC9628192.1 ATP-dependent Clp protease adaptor protein ClpS [uncultured Gamm